MKRVPLCLALSVWAAFIVRADASPDPLSKRYPSLRPSSPQANVKSFKGSLISLAAQASVGFVVEGQPLRDELPPDKALSYNRLDPVPEVVAKIADAFDYAAEPRGGIFLLRKRYRDPEDMPEVTLEECRLALEDVLRVTAPLNPGLSRPGRSNTRLDEFIKVLSPDQIKQMRTGLPISQFSPAQRAAVWQVACHLYVERSVDSVQEALRRINQATRKEAAFCFTERKQKRLFGYETLSESAPRRPVFHGLAAGDAVFGKRPEASDARRRQEAPPVKAAPENVTRTLREWAESLNERGRRTASGALPAAVEDALAAKTATIIGCEREPPDRVLQALADLYGLRLQTDYAAGTGKPEPTGYRLTRFRPRAARSMADLAEQLSRVFPAPLVRAAQPYSLIRHENFFKVRRLGKTALRQLRERVEPKITAAKNRRAPLSDCGEEARGRLAVGLIAEAMDTITTRALDTPPSYISDFPQAILTGGFERSPDPGKPPTFTVFFCRKGEKGEHFAESGIIVPWRRPDPGNP